MVHVDGDFLLRLFNTKIADLNDCLPTVVSARALRMLRFQRHVRLISHARAISVKRQMYKIDK